VQVARAQIGALEKALVYAYRNEGGDSVEILSYGSDGRPGGSGQDADIADR